NLGLLCYFKYANFFLDSLRQVLQVAGASASLPVLSVGLPVGISFYTFQAINYMVDVYRGHIRAERSRPRFLALILFFPALAAGPGPPPRGAAAASAGPGRACTWACSTS